MVAIAVLIFSMLIIIIVFFQIGLTMGMPWGEYAMGGYFPGRFPWTLRLLAIFQGLLLIIFAIIVLDKTSLFRFGFFSIPSIAIWFVVAFSLLTAVLNFIDKSKKERMVWFPTSILLLITSLIVALDKNDIKDKFAD